MNNFKSEIDSVRWVIRINPISSGNIGTCIWGIVLIHQRKLKCKIKCLFCFIAICED